MGSSGCGKSTLLNAIVGLVQLDAGEIKIPSLGKKDVGFMPQVSINLLKEVWS